MSGFRVDAVWDIETANWTEYVVGAIWTPADGVQVFRDEDDLAARLLSLPKGATAWAHAGGRFDVLWLLDWARRNDRIPAAQVRMSGSTISALSINGGPVLRDSYRLIPMSLGKASTMFANGTEKQDLALPCVCGNDCAGYCSISKTMPVSLRQRLVAYLVADVEALRDTLLGLLEYADQHGLTLRGTVAGSSWASAQLHSEIRPCTKDNEWDLRAYNFARGGYFGGRVDVARPEADHIWRYDRNSSYPAALREPVPTGEMRLVGDTKRARMVWNRDKPGVYEVSIDVPEMMAPPLPVHVAERIAYPWGRLRGTWTRPELEHAVSCGATIREITRCLAWEGEAPVLRPYVEYVWTLRANAVTDKRNESAGAYCDKCKAPCTGSCSTLAQWLKWLANSLTGAFAQDPKQDIVVLGDKVDDPRWDMVGIYSWIWRREVFRISDRAHVECAGYLTARARVELHAQIEHAADAWCYSDTDSVYATRELSRSLGGELGQWKFEGAGHDWVALAPKVYRYETEKKAVVRAKGVSDAEDAWPLLLRGEKAVNDKGVQSFLVAARNPEGLFSRSHTHKKLAPPSPWIGARLRAGSITRAPSVAELADLPR